MGIVPFESRTMVSCGDCGTSETLDGMVRKDNQKGYYHCVDCEVSDLIDRYGEKEVRAIEKLINDNKKDSKLKKFIVGLFG